MRYELSQRFFFEAAHTLQRAHQTDASRRIHGHTYRGCVTVGAPRVDSGMVVDLAVLRAAIDEVKAALDHRLLDDVEGLGAATLENLCGYIHRRLSRHDWQIVRVEVGRDASGDSCCLRTDED